MDSIYRFCSFKPANGTNLDAFFGKNNPLLSVWHAGIQMQIQLHFEDNASQAGVMAAEMKLATIAVTRF